MRAEGRAVADVPLDATLAVYGRLQNPGEDPGCYSLGDLVLCPEASAGEGLGEIAFQGGDQAPFALEGKTLTQGCAREALVRPPRERRPSPGARRDPAGGAQGPGHRGPLTLFPHAYPGGVG